MTMPDHPANPHLPPVPKVQTEYFLCTSTAPDGTGRDELAGPFADKDDPELRQRALKTATTWGPRGFRVWIEQRVTSHALVEYWPKVTIPPT
jgi:hypothetical protein